MLGLLLLSLLLHVVYSFHLTSFFSASGNCVAPIKILSLAPRWTALRAADDAQPLPLPAVKAAVPILNIPNTLSLLRVVCIPLFCFYFTSGRREAGLAVYLGSCITDFIDGWLAR